jgi:hypothetical protein
MAAQLCAILLRPEKLYVVRRHVLNFPSEIQRGGEQYIIFISSQSTQSFYCPAIFQSLSTGVASIKIPPSSTIDLTA